MAFSVYVHKSFLICRQLMFLLMSREGSLWQVNSSQSSTVQKSPNGSQPVGVSFFITEMVEFNVVLPDDGINDPKTVFQKIKMASQRFLETRNDNQTKEKLLFPMKKQWKRIAETDEDIYKKATAYLLNELKFSVTLENRSLLFKLLNIIFFNKQKDDF